MKDLKIDVPEGYVVDEEKSTFTHIVFKKIKNNWRNNETALMNGYFTDINCEINYVKDIHNTPYNHDVFATVKQAKSALAMAQISQIMANDRRFGGVITEEEWNNLYVQKYVFVREGNKLVRLINYKTYSFLAFHTQEQCDLFLLENKDLIMDYLML